MHRTHTGLWWKAVPKSISIQMVSSKCLYALSHYSMHCTGCQICAHTSLSRQTTNTNSTGLGEESPILRTVKLRYQQVCCVIRLTCIIKKKRQKKNWRQNKLPIFLYLEIEKVKSLACPSSDWSKAIPVTSLKFKSNKPLRSCTPDMLSQRYKPFPPRTPPFTLHFWQEYERSGAQRISNSRPPVLARIRGTSHVRWHLLLFTVLPTGA